MKKILTVCVAIALSSVGAVSADARGQQNRHQEGPRKEQPRRDNKHMGQGHQGHNQGHSQGRPGGNIGQGHQGRPGGNSYGRPGESRPRPDYRPHPGPGGQHHYNFRPEPPRHTPRFVNMRPSVGFSVSLGGVNLWFSNGVYYQNIGPSRYQLVYPPIGLVVPRLFNPWTYISNGILYYVDNNVVYVPHGYNFRVVGYM